MNKKITWLTNAYIVTQDSKRRVLFGHVRIIDNKIDKITRTAPKVRSKNTTVIDLKGLTLIPGFIQTHTHLCQSLFKNQADDLDLLDWLSKKIWVMEAAHDEETLYTSALMGIYELLASGTTCTLDMGTVRHTESILTAVKKTGFRANVGKCLMDYPKTTPKFLRESTWDALSEAHALYLKWNEKENDRIRISYAPRFVISCTEKLLTEVTRIAKEQKAIIHTHASENLKEIQIVKKRANCENIEYLHQIQMTSPQLVLAHCIWLKPNEMKILQKTGTNVVHCPSSNLKLASGFARVPEMLQKGINVSLGADGTPCNNNLNMFQEMRLAALIHKPANGPKAMKAQEVLDMATLNGAQALNWQNDIGSIETGKKADLVAIDLHQPENALPFSNTKNLRSEDFASSIVYSSSPQQVQWTMIDGKIVYKGRKMRFMTTQKLMEKVSDAQKKILLKTAKRR